MAARSGRTRSVISLLAVSALGLGTLPMFAAAPAQAASPTNVVDLSAGPWTVPAGVQVVQLIGIGAKGGNTANGVKGGPGCLVTGATPVSPGQTVSAVIGTPGEDGLTSGGTGTFPQAGGAGGTGAFAGGRGGNGSGGTNALSQTDSLSGGGGGGGGTGITVNGAYKLIAGGGGGASTGWDGTYGTGGNCYSARIGNTNLGSGQGNQWGSFYAQVGGIWANSNSTTMPAWVSTRFSSLITPNGGISDGATLGGYLEYPYGYNYAECGQYTGKSWSRPGGNGKLNTDPISPGVGGAGADSGWYINATNGTTDRCKGLAPILEKSPGGGGGGGWKGGGGGASGQPGAVAGGGGAGTNYTVATANLPAENYNTTATVLPQPDGTLFSSFATSYVSSAYTPAGARVKWATIDSPELPAGTSTTLAKTFGNPAEALPTGAVWGWTASGLPTGWSLNATTGVLTAGAAPATPTTVTVTATLKAGSTLPSSNKRIAQTTRTYVVGPTVPTTELTVGNQTISYGDAPASLVPALPSGTWTTEPDCAVYKSDGTTLVTDNPIPAGTYVTKCTGGTASGGDNLSFVNGTLTVTQATSDVTYTGTSGDVPAGDPVTLTANLSPSICTGTPTIVVKDSNDNPADADPANWTPGVYLVTATYAGTTNCAGSSATATITIVDATNAVTVTPDPQTPIQYGDPLPNLGYSSDIGEGSWKTEPVCALFEAGTEIAVDTTKPVPAGTYDVVCSGGETEAGDDIVYTTGSLTVEKATTAIDYTGTQTGEGQSITSGDQITLNGSLDPGVCTGGLTYTITTEGGVTTSVTSPVTTRRWAPGTYTVTADYAGSANCDAASTEATIEVVPAVVKVTVSPQPSTITYGDATPAFAPVSKGFLEWGTAESPDTDGWVTEPTCAVVSGASPLPVQTYAVVCEGGDPGTGYTVEYTDGSLTVNKQTPTVAYTGTSGVITAGASVTLNSTKSPTACTGKILYSVKNESTGEVTNLPEGTTSLSTTWWAGIYTITATYTSDSNCDGASDSAAIIVGTPGDSTTGGGWYKLDPNSYPNPRVNFGHTVQKVVQTDKKTGNVTTTYRGQVLWINSQTWRMKGSVYSRQVTNSTGGYLSGDTNPAFVKLACPSFVGQTGSGFSCGMIIGTGTLERYNADTGAWELATDIGSNGTVTFSATIYDGGQVKVCKNKTCTLTDLADYFGMAIKSDVGTGSLPSTTPIQLNNSKNGQIVIRGT